MSEKPKGPEEQKSTPTHSEMVAAHREDLKGVAREAEEQGKIVSPEEVYSRNLEQTARDVETALEQFDISELNRDYAHHVEVGHRYWDKGDKKEEPQFEYYDGYLMDYKHAQSFDVDGKRIDIAFSVTIANDDNYERHNLVITVDGKRYVFKFDVVAVNSDYQNSQFFAADASIKESGKTQEVRPGYGEGIAYEGPSYEGEKFVKGTIDDRERAILQSAIRLIERFKDDTRQLQKSYYPNL